MSSDYASGIGESLKLLGCTIVLAVVVVLVCAFFLGRCSAKYEVRTPVVEKSKV